MKKKLVLFLLIASVFCTVFSGCGNNNSDTDITTTSAVNVAQPETTESTLPTVFATINIDELTYPQYNAMSAEQQQAVIDSFEKTEDFFEWYNDAKQEHEEFQDKLMNLGNADTTGTVDSTDPNTPEQTDPVEAEGVTFLDYQAMSGNEQKKFINTFPSIDAFMQWHAAALQEYKDSMSEWGATTPTETTAP